MRRLILLSVFALFFVISASAQVTGLYSFGSFDNRGFDSVNIGNLNVHFSVPILSKQGRGMPFHYNLSYDSLFWTASSATGTTTWTPAQSFGWLADTATVTGYVTYETEDDPELYSFRIGGNEYSLNCMNYTYQPFVYTDAFGVAHTFSGQTSDNRDCHGQSGLNTPNLTATATDGSGYKISVTNYTEITITGPAGKSFVPPVNTTGGSGEITDTNGNQITTNGTGVFTDTLGTTAMTVGGNGTASSPRTLTYNVAQQADSSTTANATVSYVTYTVQTNFGCGGIGEYGPLTNDLVDRITLADGTYYQFSYENTPGISGAVTGRLASVTLPTGGTINYTYTGGCNGNGLNADGTTGSLNRATTDGTRSYGRSPSTNGSTTTLQDEAGNQTLYTFTNTNGVLYETHQQVYQGSVGASTPLLDRQTCYNSAATPCDGQTIAPPITATQIISSQNGGSSSQTQDTYDGSSGLLLTHKDFDYGSVLLQTTTYSYVSPGRVSSVTVQDGSNQTVSQVLYNYDEGSPTATSGIPQHVAVLGPRGNQTSSYTLINPSVSPTATLSTITTYYDTGVPATSTDPNGATQYTYDSTQGFATQVTPPTPSSGVSLPTTASYDVASGIPLSASDANNTTTPMVQYTQYDRLLRPKQVNTVDGGQTNYNYIDSNNRSIWIYQTANTHTDEVDQVDSFGRLSRVAVGNGQASNPWYQTDYCYDSNGRLSFQPVSYQGQGWGTPKQCSGTGTTYTYDALGRVTNINTPDGNTTYQYVGRAVKTTDVNQVVKITQYDALGRIAAVCEVSGTPYQNDSPQNCGLDISGTGYLTTYAYDLFNHKTTITQNVQQRIFQTDSLGRTVYTKEPERGVTTYSYSYPTNGLGLQVLRIRPKANQCVANPAYPNQCDPTITTTTTTQYDKVGRVVSVSYDDGLTPNKAYYYDVATFWGSIPSAGKGHLTLADGTGEATQFAYDSMGRVTNSIQCLPGLCGTNSALDVWQWYYYNLAGNLNKFFYMTNNAVGTQIETDYAYNPAGQLTSISDTRTGNLMTNFQNTQFGPTFVDLGNGLTSQRWYDTMGRYGQQVLCGTAYRNNCYNSQIYGEYGAAKGARTIGSCDTVLGECFTYGYDDLNRLSSASGNNHSLTFDYDRYGNRLHQNVVAGAAQSSSFTINLAANQIIGFSYDAAGNMTYDGGHSYTYDAEGRVLQVGGNTTASYTYDALNQRVKAVEKGTNTLYAYNINGQRVASFDGSGNPISNQVYSGSTPVAFYQGGTIHYQHQDWLGTERLRTSSTGAVEGTYQSLPFGDGFSASGTDNDAYHFAALDRDADDTHHAQFRQYSSTQGRWLSPDPYDGSYNASDPQSFNRYTYVGNRPLSSLDPSGQLCVSAFPYGNAEEPYIDPFINSAEDCGAAYGLWYDSDSSITVTTDEPDPMDPASGPGLGAIAVNPSSSGGSNDGGGGSSSTLSPSNIIHRIICGAASQLLGNAQASGMTNGTGGGGGAGAGILLGTGFTGSVQVVADPQGNVGIAISGAYTPVVVGWGYLAGGQFTLSNARSIFDLRGSSTNYGVSGGGTYGAGFDYSKSADGTVKSGTLTAGIAGGFRLSAAVGAIHTWVPKILSTNCKVH